MTTIPRNAIPMGADLDFFPPYSKERQDAELEALRYAFVELARCLHEGNLLDLQTLSGQMGNAEWIFADKSPRTLESVRELRGTLDYMRAKLGEPGLAE